jgi:NTE family protein
MKEDKKPKEGIGLALSGGGFRATLFHVGSLWRLNEFGLLPKINRITSVSGGSITAGFLGLKWNKLEFNSDGVATNFATEVAAPLREFCSSNVDVGAVIAGLISIFRRTSDFVASRYRDRLFGDATLQSLPDEGKGPHFVIYATSLQTGVSVRLSKPFLADYRLGMLRNPSVSLAEAVAASSAFPPFLSPLVLSPKGVWDKVDGADLFDRAELRERMLLTDGGVYDNMGLENIWDDFTTVLVSDAGAPLGVESSPSTLWLLQLIRTEGIMSEQTRALRKRKLIEEFKNGERKGTYWGIKTHIDNYQVNNPMVTDNDLTASLSLIRTRLTKFDPEEQGHLINWGYALTDAALRQHVPSPGTPVGSWPVPEYSLAAT